MKRKQIYPCCPAIFFPIRIYFIIGFCCLLLPLYLNSQSFTYNGPQVVPDNSCSNGYNEAGEVFPLNVLGIGFLNGNTTRIDSIRINITTTYDGDLNIWLESPTGAVLELSTGNGGSGDNYTNTVFSDVASNFITSGTPPYTGVFRPEGRNATLTGSPSNTNVLGSFTFASVFNGFDADGEWKLRICDNAALDVATLLNWTIYFTGCTQQVLNAGITGLVSPVEPFSAGNNPVSVTLRNFGTQLLTSTSVNWSVNGVLQPQYNWTGSLPTNSNEVVLIGNFNFQQNTQHTLKAWSGLVNGQADQCTANDSITIQNLNPSLSGIYTIGGSNPDFPNFTAAVSALSSYGVSGPVTFRVRNGTYTEQITIPPVFGASAQNRITFESESGDSSLVTLIHSSSSSSLNYTLRLDGADYITIRKMTLRANNITFGRVVELRGGANYNVIENNFLDGVSTASTNLNHALVYSGADQDEYNIIRNNYFLESGDGVFIGGTSTLIREAGNEVRNNVFADQYRRAINLFYQNGSIIEGNAISSNSTYSAFNGIVAYYCNENQQVLKNKVTLNNASIGIAIDNCTGSGSSRGVVANNFVQVGGAPQSDGILFYLSNNQNCYYNSVHTNSSNTNSRPLSFFSAQNVNLFNNIAYNSTAGLVIWRNSTSTLVSDHNDLATTGTTLAFTAGTNVFSANLAAWQAQTNLDSNSVSVDPQFISATDLHITNPLLNGAATPIPSIADDIDGQLRDISTPDMGADEFFTQPLDVAITALAAPQMLFPAGNQSVRVNLFNSGQNTVTSVDIHWQVNGIPQTPFNWTGSLPSGGVIDSLAIGNFTFNVGTPYDIKAWSSMPNGMNDPFNSNDTIRVDSLYAALGGTYTIGGVSPDFPNITPAVFALGKGGVVAPVIFNLRNGVYDEQITIPALNGVGSTRTVTFQSESGDSTQVTWTASMANNLQMQIISLDGADWVRIRKLTVKLFNGSSARLIKMTNGADDNIIENCVLDGFNSQSLVFLDDLVTTPNNARYRILNNVFVNGVYGLQVEGFNPAPVENFIEGNQFNHQGNIAIFLDQESNTTIARNTILKVGGGVNYTGILLQNASSGNKILANKITGDRVAEGIYVNNSTATGAAPTLIAGNFIESDWNSGVGIRVNSSPYTRISHNTVVMNGAASNCVNTRFTGNYSLYNNIFYNKGGGYAFVVTGGTTPVVASDHNNFYTTGPNLGYNDNSNFPYPDLAAWQAATPFDDNSFSVNPYIIPGTGYKVAQVLMNNTGIPDPFVTTDIEQESRNPVSPDIGCDEFTPPANDAGIESIVSPQPFFPSGNNPVRVALRNQGVNALTSVQIHWTLNDTIRPVYSWTGNLPPGDSAVVMLGDYHFGLNQAYAIQAWTSLPNGSTDVLALNDSARVTGLYPGLSGIYTIGGAQPDFNSFTQSIHQMIQGGVLGPVTFNVRDGVYTEKLRFPEIPGAAAGRSITYQSESGDSTAVRIEFNPNQTPGLYVVQLDSADWITFRRLTIKSLSASAGIVLDLRRGASNNRISNCVLQNSIANSVTVNWSTLYISTDANLNDTFTNNKIIGGSYGLVKDGPSGPQNPGVLIAENDFIDQYYYATQINNMPSLRFLRNRIRSSVPKTADFHGIAIQLCNGNLIVEGNQVVSPGILWPLDIVNCTGTSQQPVVVANNFISTSAGNVSGLSMRGNAYAYVAHNTVNVQSTNPAGSAYYQSSGSNNFVYNNIFSMEGAGAAAEYDATGSLAAADRNNYYATGPVLIAANNNTQQYGSLATWQAATPHDDNSLTLNPYFIHPDSFRVTQSALNGAAQPLAQVLTDIEGQMRDPQTPDIGCDEFNPAPLDAGVERLVAPVKRFPEGVNTIRVAFRNQGLDTLQSVQLGWSVNDTLKTPVFWNGVLPPGDTAEINLADYFFGVYKEYRLTVWTAFPNGNVDTVMTNDTIMVDSLYPALNGVYSIGGSTPDFPDFTAAILQLHNGGVLGPVTFEARPGTYQEKLFIYPVEGASATNTITFTSENADTSSVTLLWPFGGIFDFTAQINLIGADYITFSHLTINRTALINDLIQLRNGAHHNRFINNRLIRLAGNVSADLINGADFGDNHNIVIEGNSFYGGTNGIVLSAGTQSSATKTGCVIARNTFQAQNDIAIRTNGMHSAVIDSNQILGGGPSVTEVGIQYQNGKGTTSITRNKIGNIESTGILAWSFSGTASEQLTIANNFVQSNRVAGIEVRSSSFTNTLFNNVNLFGTGSNPATTAALYLNGAGAAQTILNNNFSAQNGAPALRALNTANSNLSAFNFNNYYSNGTVLARQNNTELSDLAAIQAAFGQNANSVSADPLYFTPVNLHVSQPQLDSAGTPVSGITADIDGQMRNTTAPDIGADEFDVLPLDILLQAIVAPADGCDLGAAEDVTVRLNNLGSSPQMVDQIAYQADGGAAVTETANLTLLPGEPFDYTFTAKANLAAYGNHTIRAYVNVPGDVNPANDTLDKTIVNRQAPPPPGNLLPADGTTGLEIPVLFSWSVSPGATLYDLYIWPQSGQQPAQPTVANLAQVSFSYNNLQFATAYYWKVVAKNPDCQAESPTQTFTTRQLPDLTATNIVAPPTAVAGTNIAVDWTVLNTGPGGTLNGNWNEEVFISNQPNLGANATFYFLTTRNNLSALSPGQSYIRDDIPVNLPNNISGDWYIVVRICMSCIPETTVANNTAAAMVPILITPEPPADLQVTAASVNPLATFTGDTVTVSWTVKNMGQGPTIGSFWNDRVYLYNEEILNPALAIPIGTFSRSGVLPRDSSYTRVRQIVMPDTLTGIFYVYVYTDYLDEIAEPLNEDNNTYLIDTIQIFLTPPADMVVGAIGNPASASTGQTVSINWVTRNEGADDAGAWDDRVYLSADTILDANVDMALATKSFSGPLSPGSSVAGSANVLVPANLSPGTYYFFVQTDISNTVPEFAFESNNIRRSSQSINIQRPDLSPSSLLLPATGLSGNPITVRWTTLNNGPGRLSNASYSDGIYYSDVPAYNPNTAILLQSQAFSNVNLLQGDSVTRQVSAILPQGVQGVKYIIVRTDSGNQIFENSENNNAVSGALTIQLDTWADLRPTTLNAPASANAGQTVPVSYTVRNFGVKTVQNVNWTDKIYLSDSPALNAGSLIELASVPRSLNLATNAEYSVATNVAVPLNLPSGNFYIKVFADAGDNVFEYTDESNNRLVASATAVTGYPPVDLAVTAATVNTGAVFSGAAVTVQAAIQNLAVVATIAGSWEDGVYLSTDSIYDAGDQLLESAIRNGNLSPGTSYNQTLQVQIPNGISGNFYLLFVADIAGANNDSDASNNRRKINNPAATNPTLVVTLTPPSDLDVTAFSAPAAGTAGQLVQVIWSVRNNGVGATNATAWRDRFYLSNDFQYNGGDIFLGEKIHDGPLAPAATYTDTTDIVLPLSVATGNYVLLVITDATNLQYEYQAEDNNLESRGISVVQPPPADLVVQSINVPSTVPLSELVTIGWTLKNTGSNAAAGFLEQGVYLSADSVWDAGDALFGIWTGSMGNIQPNGTANFALTQRISGVETDSLFVIVRADIKNNIAETNDSNNLKVRLPAVRATVPVLPLNVLTPDTLQNQQYLYYRLDIPPMFNNEPVLITLTGDSMNLAENELYFRLGAIPSRNMFDFKSPAPFSANQFILAPEVPAGSHYILVYGNVNGNNQPITLLAQVLPFQVRTVEAGKGGNTGYVTLKISGAKFTPDMEARLEKPGSSMTAGSVFFSSATTVYATFDLKGATLGFYDVVLEKTNGDTASLHNGFEIVAGSPGGGTTAGGGGGNNNGFICQIVNIGYENLLDLDIQHVESTRPNRIVDITVFYANTGNVDIPAPTRIMLAINGFPLGFSVAELAENKSQLVLQFAEPGGPPGILRPGASGFVKVYSKTKVSGNPPRMEFILVE